MAHAARDRGLDGVVCGHIHSAEVRQLELGLERLADEAAGARADRQLLVRAEVILRERLRAVGAGRGEGVRPHGG